MTIFPSWALGPFAVDDVVCVPAAAVSFILLNGLKKSLTDTFSSFPVLNFLLPKKAEGLAALEAFACPTDAVGLGVDAEAPNVGVNVMAFGFGLNSLALAFIFRVADGLGEWDF